tara:strand:- start:259 stop:1110 length:852 start_codon:yes stop_codon:yes gene_type:complete
MSLTNKYYQQNNSDVEALKNFKILIDNIKLLKQEPFGCPWQKIQTHESLIRYLSEESDEFIDAVYEKNINSICEELGDLLLQIMLHTQISFEENEFELNDVIKNLNMKIIKRHPYIFKKKEKVSLKKSQEIWRDIKNIEKNEQNKKLSISSNLISKIKNLPASFGTNKISKSVKEYGFKWINTNQIFDKLYEEINELKEAIKSKKEADIKDEFGDVYFTLINLANFLKINPEAALKKTNKKFLERFAIIEEYMGGTIRKRTPQDFQKLWKIAKQTLMKKQLSK